MIIRDLSKEYCIDCLVIDTLTRNKIIANFENQVKRITRKLNKINNCDCYSFKSEFKIIRPIDNLYGMYGIINCRALIIKLR